MAESQAETSTRPGGPGGALRRLSALRLPVVLFAILLIILVATATISWLAALIVFAGLLVFLAVVPGRRPEELPQATAGPVESVWPDTAIKLFADALPDPCFILDRRATVRFANRRAIDAFAIKPGDSLTFRMRVPDVVAAFDRVAKGGPAERIEFAERVPTERWFAAWFTRLEAGGRGNFIALILDDLTEPRRLERVRVDFVANASHELRTPLASLAGFIETLQGPARDDAVARERFLKIMRDQAMRMSRLVDDLLSLSRIEMKAHVRPSGEVDLGATVRHVIDALEPLARELSISVTPDVPGAPVMVTGERDELVQVFENLIENACKYGQAGKRVEVAVRPASADAGPSVSVRDFGPGVAPEHIPRLTERFYRIDVDESRRHRGTGLGLAIAKHILTRHQARLVIESRLGEGATFTVIFPHRAEPDPSDQGRNPETDQTIRPS